MRKHRPDLGLLLSIGFLMGIGLIVIYAIGPMRANFLNAAVGETVYPADFFFVRQLRSVLLAIMVLVGVYLLPVDFLTKRAKWILLGALILTLGLAVMALFKIPLADCKLGACRWYNLGFLSFQPAEALKLGLIIYLASFLKKYQDKKDATFWWRLAVVEGLALFIVVVLEKDLGTGMVLVGSSLAIFWAEGMKWWKFMAIVGVLILAGVGSIVFSSHRLERLKTFSGGAGANTYHIDNAMMAIGSGGILGVGIGNSVQATGYLPESINDSVFAVMGETFGFLGLMLILGVFWWMFGRMIKIAEKSNLEIRLITVGVWAWLAVQVLMNVSAMIGLIPLTGITLPLMSYGGSSMLFVAAALGMVLKFSCYTNREVNYESDSGRRGIRRSYHASRISR